MRKIYVNDHGPMHQKNSYEESRTALIVVIAPLSDGCILNALRNAFGAPTERRPILHDGLVSLQNVKRVIALLIYDNVGDQFEENDFVFCDLEYPKSDELSRYCPRQCASGI
jgi:hypothetical protein